jgi:hypothetical protein
VVNLAVHLTPEHENIPGNEAAGETAETAKTAAVGGISLNQFLYKIGVRPLRSAVSDP